MKLTIIGLLLLIIVGCIITLHIIPFVEGMVFDTQSEYKKFLTSQLTGDGSQTSNIQYTDTNNTSSYEASYDDSTSTDTSSTPKSLFDIPFVRMNISNIDTCKECKDPSNFDLLNESDLRSKFNCSVNTTTTNDSMMVYDCDKYMQQKDNNGDDIVVLCNGCNKYSISRPTTEIESKWYKKNVERNNQVKNAIKNYMSDTLSSELQIKEAGEQIKALANTAFGDNDAEGVGNSESCNFKSLHHNIYPNQYDLGLLACMDV